MHLHIVPNNLMGISYLLNHECRSLIREILCTSCPVRFNVGHGHPLPAAVTTRSKLSIIHQALSQAILSLCARYLASHHEIFSPTLSDAIKG